VPATKGRYRRIVTTPAVTWADRHRAGVDALIALTFLVNSEIYPLIHSGTGSVAVHAVLGATACAPLVWARRSPVAVWAVSTVSALAAIVLLPSPGPLLGAPLVCILVVAMTKGRKISLQVAGASLATVVICAAAGWRPTNLTWANFVLPLLLIWGLWAVGDNFGVRRAYLGEPADKAARAEAERDVERERATAQERARIARELHDVVAHHVSVIAIQAGAARMLSESSGASDGAEGNSATLRSIELTARQALSWTSGCRAWTALVPHASSPGRVRPGQGVCSSSRHMTLTSTCTTRWRRALPVSCSRTSRRRTS